MAAHLAASSFIGGPESQVLGLIRTFAASGDCRSAVLSFSEGGRCRPLLDAARALGAETVELEANAPRYRAAAREVAGHLRRLGADVLPGASYVRPALVEMAAQEDCVRSETFAPLLYVLRYSDLDEAIRLQNDVPQGLASSIFTTDLREAFGMKAPRGEKRRRA